MASEVVEFNLHGLPELYRDLKQINFAGQQQVLLKAARAGAEVIRDRIAQLAPRRSGHLSGDIIISGAGQRNDLNSVRLLIGPSRDSFYGLFLEIGTAFITARPFLDPAFTQMQQTAMEKIAGKLRTELDRRLAA